MNITINVPENSVDTATVQGKHITIYFPVAESTIETVIEKGVLFGIQGAQGIGVPAGGTIGQVLTKNSNNSYDTAWEDVIGAVESVNGKTGAVVLDKSDIDLGNVDNTSDIDKPISTLVQNALNLKEGVITAGTTAQYWRGDKTFQTLDKNAVGLSNVDNTSDANKPISTATQTALNAKQNTITLTTSGNSGASTFAANVLNIPTYTLAGLGGQPLNANLTSISALTYSALGFVKMTAAGTFALDTNTYLTAESDTLNSVTGRGNSTTNFITIGGITANQSVTASAGVGRGSYFNQTLIASANNDVLVGLDINPTFTNGSFTGVGNFGLRVNGLVQIANGQAIFFAPSGVFTGTTMTLQIGNLTSWNQAFSISGSSATKYMQMFHTTGNFVFQNGGTFTDAGYRLDVNGTVRIQNQLTTTGSITAASAIARGVYMNNTLVAAANNDVLVGLDIAPTFTNGSFTGVTKTPFRVFLDITTTNYIRYYDNAATGYSSFEIRNDNVGIAGYASIQSRIQTRVNYLQIYSPADTGTIFGITRNGWAGNISEQVAGMMFGTATAADVVIGTNNTATIRLFNATRNVVIQNGGTFTDNGFRLEVVGTARITNTLTLGSLSADPTGANGMIYYNTTLGMFRVYQSGAWKTITAV